MKGTYEIVSEIMKENGFKIIKGKFPEGLELTIRQMLSKAYMIDTPTEDERND